MKLNRRGQRLLGIAGLSAVCASAGAADFNLTLDADFASGTLNGVNFDAPNSNQLQLNTQGTTFPLLWIANAGEDTLSRIDVDGGPDGEGCESARYQTGFGPTAAQAGFVSHLNNAFFGPAPSRTAVDGEGNVYVANRGFGRIGGVMKILRDGGIDRNNNGTIDTSSDVDGDCAISRDPADGEIIPLSDNNANGVIDPEEITDERVAWYTSVGPSNVLIRSLCIAPDGNIWAGTFNFDPSAATIGPVYELDADTGAIVSGPHAAGSIQKYGCAIDADGIMYSATISNNMEIFDTNTNTHLGTRQHVGSNYGMTIGNGGQVYLAQNGGAGYNVYDPDAGAGDASTGTFQYISGVGTRGIGVDGDGNIFIGREQLQKFNSSNASQFTVANPAGFQDQRGVIVDSNQDLWMVNKNGNSVSKFRNDGTFVKILPVGNQPYTYSDATGIGFRTQTDPSGIWRVILSEVGGIWDALSYNNEPEGNIPTGASIEVEARVADTEAGLALASFQTVAQWVHEPRPRRRFHRGAHDAASEQCGRVPDHVGSAAEHAHGSDPRVRC